MPWTDLIPRINRAHPSDDRRIREVKADIAAELEFHLSMAIEEGELNGLTTDEAKRVAHNAFGDRNQIESACRNVQLGDRTWLMRTGIVIAASAATMMVVLLVNSYRRQRAQQAELRSMQTSIDELQGSLFAISAQAPPVVIETFPAVGATGVDPNAAEIRVRFSKEMLDGSWSWCETEAPFPSSIGPIRYAKDSKTCVMPVQLKPGTKYVVAINSPNHRNFRDTRGNPAPPYLLHFATASDNQM